MEAPTVTAQDPQHNDDDVKKGSTPSVRSNDGSKEKDGGFYNDIPIYTDVEGQESEIHLETAKDIVTQVIHLDDDPTINPWTFRMFFLGTAALPGDPNPVLPNHA